MSEVTQLLEAIQRGQPHAANDLLPLVYQELRQLAAARLAQERPGQTLEATALVHEAYLRLVGGPGTDQHWQNRSHFFAAAAEAIRRILIEQARHKASLKAGGYWQRVELSEIPATGAGSRLDILALHEALEGLEQSDPRAATVVKLRFFVGMTMAQVADALQLSLATVENDWAYAKCSLRLQLGDNSLHESDRVGEK